MAIHIESSTSSADMWKVLAGIANSADTETGRDLLFREFIDIKAIPGEPLSNFFGKLQETVGLLAGTDHQISPYHRTQLLRNLPSEYDMIRTVIEDKTLQPTIQSIIETLKRTERELDTEKKKVTSTNTSATSEAALYAGQTQARRGRGGYYRGSRGISSRFSNHRSTPYTDTGNKNCYTCGKPGHRAAQCPLTRIECFNCGDTAHRATDCPHETLTQEQARRGRSAYSGYLDRKAAKANLAEESENKEPTDEPLLLTDGQAHTRQAHTRLSSLVLLSFALLSSPLSTSLTVIDSGASHHMFNRKHVFLSLSNFPQAIPIKLSDGKTVISSKGRPVKIRNILIQALYVPTFRVSLLSVSRLRAAGYKTTFQRNFCTTKNEDQRTTFTGNPENGIYILQEDDHSHNALLATEPSTETWHRCLRHINHEYLKTSFPKQPSRNLAIYVSSRNKRAPHRKTPATRATHPFELIHSDSYSIFGNPSLSGTLHYLLFTDDFTRWTFVYLNSKNAENCTQAFKKTLADNGIIFEPSPPYTQNMNGVSEMFGANGGSRPFMDGLASP